MVFNLSFPLRSAFQCVSADTEILTDSGWKTHATIELNDLVATFNVDNQHIEYNIIQRLFREEYNGMMYNLKNRITDQMVSPRHRIIHKKFNSDNDWVVNPIEKCCEFKSGVIIPVGSNGVVKDSDMSDEWIQLIAWIIADGTYNTTHDHIILFKSPERYPEYYAQIKDIIDALELDYKMYEYDAVLGNHPIRRFEFTDQSSERIMEFFDGGVPSRTPIKYIPRCIRDLNCGQSMLFIDTYLKADNGGKDKIISVDKQIIDGIANVCVNAGCGSTIRIKQPSGKISKKVQYVLRIIRHMDTYVTDIKQVEYKGVIWCPTTENGTFIARRNGKVFATGNTPFTNLSFDLTTPFTNLSFDLTCPEHMKNEPVIIGGLPTEDTYNDFQDEMDMINIAFLNVMLQGDKDGNPHTFPIPTYSITKDFNWDCPVTDKLFELTSKFGLPYFMNYIGSGLDPSSTRSMCCRLNLRLEDVVEASKGGLWNSGVGTGSLSVVTINMPQLGFLAHRDSIPKIIYEPFSHDEMVKAFYKRLDVLLDAARQHNEWKRIKINDGFEMGLMPFSKSYMKNFDSFFSTIGVVGMNECCLNMFGKPIYECAEFVESVLEYMHEYVRSLTRSCGYPWNLEETPSEGCSSSLAIKDVAQYPGIITQGSGSGVFYTNSSHIYVGDEVGLGESLRIQERFKKHFNGGTLFHIFCGENAPITLH